MSSSGALHLPRDERAARGHGQWSLMADNAQASGRSKIDRSAHASHEVLQQDAERMQSGNEGYCLRGV
jgi:hypothetical protein